MEKICHEIDKALLAVLPDQGLKAYGLCELVKKGNQQTPVTVDSTRKPATFVDSLNGHFYHRLLNSSVNEDLDMSFGLDTVDRSSPRLRIFLAYKINLGENFVFEFINAIPRKIEVEGYKFIHRSASIDLIADHEGVYNQEYGDTSYEKHRTPYNIYAIEFNMEFIKC